MNETCDRCGPPIRATYRVTRAGRELCLCTACSFRLRKALSAQGWAIWPLAIQAIAPQTQTGTRHGR